MASHPRTPSAQAALLDRLALAVALLSSLLLVWFVARQPLVVAGFAGGALVLLGALRLVPALQRPADEAPPAEPDWSVTVAAIDHPDSAVAVTDRAGRLVCANRLFETAFGIDRAPPQLPVGEAGAQRLAQAAQAAWRDGNAGFDGIVRSGQLDGQWLGSVRRAGRGEDFLVWQLRLLKLSDPVAELVSHLDGKLGRALSLAGLAAAIVDPDGQVRAATVGFAERATGDPHGAVAGRDFVGLLAQDEQEKLYWARDAARAGPLTLFHIPLADPDRRGAFDPATMPSLMVLADTGIGLGGDLAAPAAAPHLEALLAQLPLGLAMADRDGRLLFANPAFMRAAGREGQPPPTYPTDLVVREDKAAVSDAVRRFGGSGSAGDVAVRLAAQPDEPVSLSLAGVRGLGEATVLLSLADSSEETRLKRQVAQATKMQAVGQLAGGVAHDFNNVLTAIIGTCDLMLLRHMPGDSDYDDIQQIRASSNRAASLTRHLLAFSRQQTLRPEVLQLPDVVSEVSQMLKRLIGERIGLEVTHDRDLGPVRADPTQLEQVIVNLTVNARDAIQGTGQAVGKGATLSNEGGAGHIRIQTRRVTTADVRAMRSEILPVADYTAMVVEDTGGGIPEEVLAKIFEPFYTTKEMGKGTGLGLSTVYGIVKQSGGFIFADNCTNASGQRGARFTIFLPVHHFAPGEATQPAKPREETSSWAGGGLILLVEDEDSVRMVAERALTRAGYAVTLARDGDDGLDRLKELIASGEPMFDLVLSDVVMPGLDGPAMVREIRRQVPKVPVLFMSGHAEEQLRREIDVEDAHFIAKPFSLQQIVDKVASVLTAGR